MNTDINDKIEMEALETGNVLDDEDTFYAVANKTVTLPNDNGGFTNHPKGARVKIDKEEAIKRFSEDQVTKLMETLDKHRDPISLKEVVENTDQRRYSQRCRLNQSQTVITK